MSNVNKVMNHAIQSRVIKAIWRVERIYNQMTYIGYYSNIVKFYTKFFGIHPDEYEFLDKTGSKFWKINQSSNLLSESSVREDA